MNETMKVDVEKRAEQAESLFREGYNCAQSVYLAFADVCDISKEQAALISAPFGGGMGRMREVCGACSGMFMVAAHMVPANDPHDKTAKAENYKLVQDMASDYRAETGSIICKELLGLNKPTNDPLPEERTEAYYKKRPCAELVHLAASIVAKKINQKE